MDSYSVRARQSEGQASGVPHVACVSPNNTRDYHKDLALGVPVVPVL